MSTPQNKVKENIQPIFRFPLAGEGLASRLAI